MASEKDFWDKIDIILKPVGGLFTALAVAALGYYGSALVERQQSMDARVRLYSELMSKREEAESALRKDMFVSIIQSFLSPEGASLDTKVLNLELLAYNFHDALNLKPLFMHINKKVQAAQGDPARNEYKQRLIRVAREVTRKQLMVLEGVGQTFNRTVDFEEFRATPGGIVLDPAELIVGGIKREFKVIVLKEDPELGEIRVRLEIRTLGGQQDEVSSTEFWVGPFDFPMIDNVRLAGDQRCAVVLNNYNNFGAELTVVYFPGSYASLKEKPYFQEVVNQLLMPQIGAGNDMVQRSGGG